MKKLIILFIIFCAASMNYAQTPLINISDYSWWGTNNLGPFNGSTNITTNFYKFVVQPPILSFEEQYPLLSWPMNAYPGETLYIPVNIDNVGSIDELQGVHLSVGNTSIPAGVAIAFCSAPDINSPLPGNNTPPIWDGTTYQYYIAITVPDNSASENFIFTVTNTGSIHTTPYPYKYVITYPINIIQQDAAVDHAFDGIHYIYGNDQFNGRNPLGNIDTKIYIKLTGEISEAKVIRLYYDMDAVPDKSTPDGTINKNRYITMVQEGGFWVATIPVTDPEVVPGKVVNFVVYVDGHLYYYDDDTKQPWTYLIKEYAEQKEESATTISINNKFDPTTDQPYSLIYTLNRRSFVNISVYNIRGECVRRIKHAVENIGKHIAQWDGKNDSGKYVSMGLYLVNIQSAEFGDIRKVIVIKR